MKKLPQKKIRVALLFLCIFYALIEPASAHRVNVFAWVEGDTVTVEAKFPGGKNIRGGKIIVLDAQGNELISGLTDDEGEFSFKVPKRTDLKIILNAGQGHQAEWSIGSSEIADLPSKAEPVSSAETPKPSDRFSSVAPKTDGTEDAAPYLAAKPEQLEAIIESVLDRKLKPLTRMLADIRQGQEGPDLKDVISGIGYILGLVGIAAFIQSRKKKE